MARLDPEAGRGQAASSPEGWRKGTGREALQPQGDVVFGIPGPSIIRDAGEGTAFGSPFEAANQEANKGWQSISWGAWSLLFHPSFAEIHSTGRAGFHPASPEVRGPVSSELLASLWLGTYTFYSFYFIPNVGAQEQVLMIEI